MSDHDGGADIEVLANMYDCVRELRDERDRLRAMVDAFENGPAIRRLVETLEASREGRPPMDDCPHGHQRRTCETCELEAERDRLRAVVDAVRKTVGGSIQAIEAARAEEMGRDVILRNVAVALTKAYDQLDVSAEVTDA